MRGWARRAGLRRRHRGAAAVLALLALGAASASADPVDLIPLPGEPEASAPPSASAPSPTALPAAPAGGFILADSGRRELTAQEIAKIPCDRLIFARNEIFARHGRYFQREDLTRYFSQFAWYKPRTWSVKLTAVEQENVRLL